MDGPQQFDLFTGGFYIKIPMGTRSVQTGVLEFAPLLETVTLTLGRLNLFVRLPLIT